MPQKCSSTHFNMSCIMYTADTSFTCPPLNNPANGEVSVSGLSVGSTASFSCNFGYVLRGSAVLECGARGIWSAPDPTCERKLNVHIILAYYHNRDF